LKEPDGKGSRGSIAEKRAICYIILREHSFTASEIGAWFGRAENTVRTVCVNKLSKARVNAEFANRLDDVRDVFRGPAEGLSARVRVEDMDARIKKLKSGIEMWAAQLAQLERELREMKA
jgi:hypothetical protein